MEGSTVSAVTELLVNVLIGSVSAATLSLVFVNVQNFRYDRKREKREEETARRDAEYHLERMKDIRK